MENNPIIEIRGVGKRYNINHISGRYVALRDVIMNILRSPFKFLKKKAREIAGMEIKEEFWALKDVTANIYKGEVVGIIGPNGSGKSTLLKILTGITPPTEGEIIMQGKVASLLEVGTGFHPELTGRENIFLNGAIIGMSRKEITKKFDEIVTFSGVEKFIDTPVKYYSSGMYVRLAFSVAAHMEPDILLVDEVLAVGDAEFQKKCIGKMEEVTKQAGRTILFVSHNMSAIKQLCNKCILLENGQVKMFGNTSDVVDFYISQISRLNSIPLKERRDRRGNQELKITDCYLKGRDDKKTNQVISGESTTIVFEYECKEGGALQNVTIAASIANKDDISLCACHSEMTQTNFGIISGIGSFKCTLPKIPLVAGTYHINMRAASNYVELDRILNIFSFDVLPGDFFGTGSNINHSEFFIEQKWSQ
jgi:lipopolysaccharide transport system ATP-binding protein